MLECWGNGDRGGQGCSFSSVHILSHVTKVMLTSDKSQSVLYHQLAHQEKTELRVFL